MSNIEKNGNRQLGVDANGNLIIQKYKDKKLISLGNLLYKGMKVAYSDMSSGSHKNIIGVENIDGKNTVIMDLYKGHQYEIFPLDDDLNLTSNESYVWPDSKDFYKTEDKFAQDINEDGIVGYPMIKSQSITNIEKEGEYLLGVDANDDLIIQSRINEKFIPLGHIWNEGGTKIGYSDFFREGSPVHIIGAERIDGDINLLWDWYQGQEYEIILLDNDLSLTSTRSIIRPDSKDFYKTEEKFVQDINDDGIIGYPIIKNKSVVNIEKEGDYLLGVDTNDNLILQTRINEKLIPLGYIWNEEGMKIAYSELSAGNDEHIIGVERIDGKINIIKDLHQGQMYGIIQLDNDGAYTDNRSVVWPDTKDFYKTEKKFVQDINLDGIIGDPKQSVDAINLIQGITISGRIHEHFKFDSQKTKRIRPEAIKLGNEKLNMYTIEEGYLPEIKGSAFVKPADAKKAKITTNLTSQERSIDSYSSIRKTAIKENNKRNDQSAHYEWSTKLADEFFEPNAYLGSLSISEINGNKGSLPNNFMLNIVPRRPKLSTGNESILERELYGVTKYSDNAVIELFDQDDIKVAESSIELEYQTDDDVKLGTWNVHVSELPPGLKSIRARRKNGSNISGFSKPIDLIIPKTNSYLREQIGAKFEETQEGEGLGTAKSISENGRILAIGSPYAENNDKINGSVSVFEYRESEWKQLGQTLEGKKHHGSFGHSVSLSNDGKLLAVGEPNTSGCNPEKAKSTGNLYLYKYIKNRQTWQPIFNKKINEKIDTIASGAKGCMGIGKSVEFIDNNKTLQFGSNINLNKDPDKFQILHKLELPKIPMKELNRENARYAREKNAANDTKANRTSTTSVSLEGLTVPYDYSNKQQTNYRDQRITAETNTIPGSTNVTTYSEVAKSFYLAEESDTGEKGDNITNLNSVKFKLEIPGFVNQEGINVDLVDVGTKEKISSFNFDKEGVGVTDYVTLYPGENKIGYQIYRNGLAGQQFKEKEDISSEEAIFTLDNKVEKLGLTTKDINRDRLGILTSSLKQIAPIYWYITKGRGWQPNTKTLHVSLSPEQRQKNQQLYLFNKEDYCLEKINFNGTQFRDNGVLSIEIPKSYGSDLTLFENNIDDSQPVFSGLADEKVSVSLKSGGKTYATAQSDNNGRWNISPEQPLEPGRYAFQVEMTDDAGNVEVTPNPIRININSLTKTVSSLVNTSKHPADINDLLNHLPELNRPEIPESELKLMQGNIHAEDQWYFDQMIEYRKKPELIKKLNRMRSLINTATTPASKIAGQKNSFFTSEYQRSRLASQFAQGAFMSKAFYSFYNNKDDNNDALNGFILGNNIVAQLSQFGDLVKNYSLAQRMTEDKNMIRSFYDRSTINPLIVSQKDSMSALGFNGNDFKHLKSIVQEPFKFLDPKERIDSISIGGDNFTIDEALKSTNREFVSEYAKQLYKQIWDDNGSIINESIKNQIEAGKSQLNNEKEKINNDIELIKSKLKDKENAFAKFTDGVDQETLIFWKKYRHLTAYNAKNKGNTKWDKFAEFETSIADLRDQINQKKALQFSLAGQIDELKKAEVADMENALKWHENQQKHRGYLRKLNQWRNGKWSQRLRTATTLSPMIEGWWTVAEKTNQNNGEVTPDVLLATASTLDIITLALNEADEYLDFTSSEKRFSKGLRTLSASSEIISGILLAAAMTSENLSLLDCIDAKQYSPQAQKDKGIQDCGLSVEAIEGQIASNSAQIGLAVLESASSVAADIALKNSKFASKLGLKALGKAAPVLGVMSTIAGAIEPAKWDELTQKENRANDYESSENNDSSSKLMAKTLKRAASREKGYYAARTSVDVAAGLVSSALMATGFGAPAAFAVMITGEIINGVLTAVEQGEIYQEIEDLQDEMRSTKGAGGTLKGYFNKRFTELDQDYLKSIEDKLSTYLTEDGKGYDDVSIGYSINLSQQDLDIATYSRTGSDLNRNYKNYFKSLSKSGDKNNWVSNDLQLKMDKSIVELPSQRQDPNNSSQTVPINKRLVKFMGPLQPEGVAVSERKQDGKNKYLTSIKWKDLKKGWHIIDTGGASSTFALGDNWVTKAKTENGYEDISMSISAGDGNDVYFASLNPITIDFGQGLKDSISYASDKIKYSLHPDDHFKDSDSLGGLNIKRKSTGDSLNVSKTIKKGQKYLKQDIRQIVERQGKDTEIREYFSLLTDETKEDQTVIDNLKGIEILSTSQYGDTIDLSGTDIVHQLSTNDGHDLIKDTGNSIQSVLTGKGDDALRVSSKLPNVIMTGPGQDFVVISSDSITNLLQENTNSNSSNSSSRSASKFFDAGPGIDVLKVPHNLIQQAVKDHKLSIESTVTTKELSDAIGDPDGSTFNALQSYTKHLPSLSTIAKDFEWYSYTIPNNHTLESANNNQEGGKIRYAAYATPSLNGFQSGNLELDNSYFIEEYKNLLNYNFSSLDVNIALSAENLEEPVKIWGSAHDDKITGSASADFLYGGYGNDVLQTRGGKNLQQDYDILMGGLGFDVYINDNTNKDNSHVTIHPGNDLSTLHGDILRTHQDIDNLLFLHNDDDLILIDETIGSHSSTTLKDFYKDDGYTIILAPFNPINNAPASADNELKSFKTPWNYRVLSSRNIYDEEKDLNTATINRFRDYAEKGTTTEKEWNNIYASQFGSFPKQVGNDVSTLNLIKSEKIYRLGQFYQWNPLNPASIHIKHFPEYHQEYLNRSTVSSGKAKDDAFRSVLDAIGFDDFEKVDQKIIDRFKYNIPKIYNCTSSYFRGTRKIEQQISKYYDSDSVTFDGLANDQYAQLHSGNPLTRESIKITPTASIENHTIDFLTFGTHKFIAPPDPITLDGDTIVVYGESIKNLTYFKRNQDLIIADRKEVDQQFIAEDRRRVINQNISRDSSLTLINFFDYADKIELDITSVDDITGEKKVPFRPKYEQYSVHLNDWNNYDETDGDDEKIKKLKASLNSQQYNQLTKHINDHSNTTLDIGEYLLSQLPLSDGPLLIGKKLSLSEANDLKDKINTLLEQNEDNAGQGFVTIKEMDSSADLSFNGISQRLTMPNNRSDLDLSNDEHLDIGIPTASLRIEPRDLRIIDLNPDQKTWNDITTNLFPTMNLNKYPESKECKDLWGRVGDASPIIDFMATYEAAYSAFSSLDNTQ